MKHLFLIAVFGMLVSICLADEPKLDYQALGTGVGLLAAPAPFVGNDLSLGHTWELEGFSYAATDVMGRLFPKDLNWVAPILMASADLLYRSGEGLENDLTRRKLACDWLGVLGRVSVDIKF